MSLSPSYKQQTLAWLLASLLHLGLFIFAATSQLSQSTAIEELTVELVSWPFDDKVAEPVSAPPIVDAKPAQPAKVRPSHSFSPKANSNSAKEVPLPAFAAQGEIKAELPTEVQNAQASSAPLTSEPSDQTQFVVTEPIDTKPSAANTSPTQDSLPYGSKLLQHLSQFQDYPRRARLMKMQGEVLLHLEVDLTGEVTGLEINRSSGSFLLDQAALALIERAKPLPKPPSGTAHKILLPIRYQLSP